MVNFPCIGHLRDPPRCPIVLSRFIFNQIVLILWRVSWRWYSSASSSFNLPMSNSKSFNLCSLLDIMTSDLLDFQTASFFVRLSSFTSSSISMSCTLRYLISLSSFSSCDYASCTTWRRTTLAGWSNSFCLINWYSVYDSWGVSLLNWFKLCVLVIISCFDCCECSLPMTFIWRSFISFNFFVLGIQFIHNLLMMFHRIHLILGVLGVQFINQLVRMFHLLDVLGLEMTNHVLMTFFCIHHLLVVLGMEMTYHLLMTFFCICIPLGVLGLEITDHFLMIVLSQLTFILVREHK